MQPHLLEQPLKGPLDARLPRPLHLGAARLEPLLQLRDGRLPLLRHAPDLFEAVEQVVELT